MNRADECLGDAALSAIACNKLDDAELRCWERHLERCDSCRQSLEANSADAQTWESVRQYLRDDDNDQQRFACDKGAARGTSYDCDELIRFLAPTDDPRMLGRLGAYEIAGIVGVGGMGIVLKAMEPALSRFVALKVLSPRFWKDAQARERFAREARAAASIVHENVIEIYGVAEVNGIPFFAMPYLRGDSLQKRIDRRGPLQVDEILRIAIQVASGLAAAHDQGLVHRDVKPANILLSDGSERVRITDFGIAHRDSELRITQTGLVAGTPRFMSPEQVRGEMVDSRSDLFSLGSVMYAACTGRPPFDADSDYQLLSQVVAARPPRIEELNPAIPSWLAAVVSKLQSPLPQNRFPSARELAEQLEQCLAAVQKPQSLSPPRSVTRLDKWYRRQRRVRSRRFILGGSLMLALTIAAVALLGTGLLHAPATPAAAKPIQVAGKLVDGKGAPVANVTILAVQKTWPNNQYHQEMRSTTTDKQGRFVFDDFAQPGGQYAYLLTVVSDAWLMTSEYRVVKDGKQLGPITLKTAKADPVTFRLQAADGKPVAEVGVLPAERTAQDGQEYISYPQQIFSAGVPTDEQGDVRFASWKPGERGAIVYLLGDQVQTFKFTVPQNRLVSLTVERPQPKPPAGPPVHVSGKVIDADGKPLADVALLAIRKTWPNNRYRQEALATKTDADGAFRFDDFAEGGRQYAFLLTVLADGYAMTSQYELVRDGTQQEPVTLTLEKAEPVTFLFQDADGQPLEGVFASPGERTIDKATSFLNYSMHGKSTGKQSDAQGQATFTAWKPGESGTFYYRDGQQEGELHFKVGPDRRVAIEVPPAK